MKNKSLKTLDESSDCIELFNNTMDDYTLLEPDGLELFLFDDTESIEPLTDKKSRRKYSSEKNVVNISFANSASTTRRPTSNIESRIDSVLAELIEQRIQTKPLPIALRKRLMYQRTINT